MLDGHVLVVHGVLDGQHVDGVHLLVGFDSVVRKIFWQQQIFFWVCLEVFSVFAIVGLGLATEFGSAWSVVLVLATKSWFA